MKMTKEQRRERDEQVVQKVSEGMPFKDIAEEMNISASLVSKISSVNGVKSRVKRDSCVTPDLAEKWYKDKYVNGKSGAEIARDETFTVKTVNMHIQRYKRSIEEKNRKPKNNVERAIMSIDKLCKKVKSKNYTSLRRMVQP